MKKVVGDEVLVNDDTGRLQRNQRKVMNKNKIDAMTLQLQRLFAMWREIE